MYEKLQIGLHIDIFGIIFTGCFDFGDNFEEEKAEADKWMSLFEENYTIELSRRKMLQK